MDFWPTTDRNELATTSGHKAKLKRKGRDNPPNYPQIVQGSLTAITLAKKETGLEWFPIVKNLPANGISHVKKPSLVFPPTRPPAFDIPRKSVRQRVEQGATFLRTFLPDVDIPAELFRDEIAQSTKAFHHPGHFDPFMGNLLEPIVVSGSLSGDAAVLAFPMGETNCDLNISAMTYTESEGILFKPSAQPSRTYNTPIQQITSSKPRHDIPQNSYVAIRTFGLTSLLKLVATEPAYDSIQTVELATIRHANIGNRAIVDFKLSPSPIEGLAVNDRGQLYRCTFDTELRTPLLVHSETIHDQESFWRVATSGNNACLFMSKKNLKYMDFRGNDHLDLFSVSRPHDVLTSVEDDDESNIIRLCSTREILWIDKRFPAKPILGYAHGRTWDRLLQTQTLHMSHELTLLTSRTNGLITMYDIACPVEDVWQLDTAPYYLWPKNEVSDIHHGQAAFRHPLASRNEDFNMFRLSDRGSIFQFNLFDREPSENRFGVFFSEDMKKLEQEAAGLYSDDGPLGHRDFSETDFVSPYNHIFSSCVEGKGPVQEKGADALHNFVDEISTFWEKSDVPTGQMLTTHDVFFRSGTESVGTSRADFLAKSLINSPQEYRGIVHERLLSQRLINKAAWHLDIVPVLKKIDPPRFRDALSWTRSMDQDGLVDNQTVLPTRQEKEAREQLILDLSFSNDVFSAQKFSRDMDEAMELEEMTKILSITGETPRVDFGYFRPTPKNFMNHYTRSENDEIVMPTGIRMLVKNWKVGEDPDTYDFLDHYNETTDSQKYQRTKFHKSPTQVTIPESSQLLPNIKSLRPPSLAPTILPLDKPGGHTGHPLKAHSSLMIPQFGSQLVNSSMPPVTEEFMASTQVLSGPYGGRPSVNKKKPFKKRLGGF